MNTVIDDHNVEEAPKMTFSKIIECAAGVALEEARFMNDTARKHPSNSEARHRCFARARTASHIANEIKRLKEFP